MASIGRGRLPESVQELRIRRAAPADALALAAVACRTFRDTFAADNDPADMQAYLRQSFGVDRLRSELADGRNTFFLAFAGAGIAAGYAKLRAGVADASVRGPSPIEIERLYVEHFAIGKGVGAKLLRVCLREAVTLGHETAWLGVWEHNARAMSFYEQWGFETVGSHVFRLGSDDQIDLIMERSLRPEEELVTTSPQRPLGAALP